MNIYVGNLSFNATEDDIRQAFAAYGQVSTASIVKDKFTGQSRGFGFVEMPDATEAQAAIAGLNGKEIQGRALTVNEARPRTEGGPGGGGRGGFGANKRPGGGGFGGDRRGGGGGGGGGGGDRGRRSW